MWMQPLKEWVRPYYVRKIFFQFHPRGKPTYFRSWQEYPAVDLHPAASRHAPAEAQPSFLFWPMADWHLRVQRLHHFARGLADRGHRCYYLNPHLGRQFDSLYREDPSPRCVSVAANVLELHVRLPREPVYHERMLTRGESATLAAQIGELAGIEERVTQIVTLPVWMAAAVELRARYGWPIIYDCHDFIAGFPKMKRAVVEAEPQAMAEADSLVFSSDFLARRFSGGRPYTIIRNAVNPDRFANAESRAGNGVVGYFGALDRWFDIDAVETAARCHPRKRFRLIGCVEDRRVLRLRRLPNVEFTGEIAHEQLPDELAGFDAAMIPFRVSDLTCAANPVKLYEYFAQGKPVVSTALPEVERYGDLVYIGRDAADFANQIQRAVAESNPDLRARRLRIARQETWQSRVSQLEAIASTEASVSR